MQFDGVRVGLSTSGPTQGEVLRRALREEGGFSYRNAVLALAEDGRVAACLTLAAKTDAKAVTTIEELGPFWQAEPEHQDYLLNFPNGYTCHFPRPGWVLPKRDAASTR